MSKNYTSEYDEKHHSYFGVQTNLIENTSQKHDKSFKKALSDPTEMSYFLNDFININVDSGELKKYKTEYITNLYKTKQSDIIYKLEKKQIYYIIEHQSTIDVNMPYRMLNYCMELVKDIIENNPKEIYPTIVPVVLYTGNRKWTVPNNFSEKQLLSVKQYKNFKINMKYKLVDINLLTDDELLIKQTFTANMMLMEKSLNKDVANKNIIKIIENTKDIKQLEKFRNYIMYIQKDALQGNENSILEMIDRKVGDDAMTALAEMWKRENEVIRNNARKEGEAKGEARGEVKGKLEGKLEKILETITKMLQNGEPDDKIKFYTDATDEQIAETKKKLGITA